jgi:hypothetical protein
MELKDQVLESLYGHQPIKTVLINLQKTVFLNVCENAFINPKQWEHDATVSKFLDAEPRTTNFRAVEESGQVIGSV